jgi:hypothetical protein
MGGLDFIITETLLTVSQQLFRHFSKMLVK